MAQKINVRIDMGWRRCWYGRSLHYFQRGETLCGKKNLLLRRRADDQCSSDDYEWPRCKKCQSAFIRLTAGDGT